MELWRRCRLWTTPARPVYSVQQLGLHPTPKRLDNDIVVAAADASHRRDEPRLAVGGAAAGIDEVAVPPVVDRLLGRLDHRRDLSDTSAAFDQIDDATTKLGCVCTRHLAFSSCPEKAVDQGWSPGQLDLLCVSKGGLEPPRPKGH